MADLFTDDEGNKTCKNLTKNNDVINKTDMVTRNFMNTVPISMHITSTPYGTNTLKTIDINRPNTDLLNDNNKNLEDKDTSSTGFYLIFVTKL